MKHVSKFDGCVYDISYSMTMEKGELKSDGITVIWKNAPCGVDDAFNMDLPIMEFIDWYAGNYDYDDVEWHIKKHYQDKLNKKESEKKLTTMCLPIAYVHLIADCLDVIKKHELYKLLEAYDGTEKMIDILQSNVEEVIDYTERIDVWADCDDVLIAKEK